VVRQIENIGGARNWRFVLSTPRTRYVAILEDDNLWEPDHLQRAIEALEAEPRATFYSAKTVSFGGRVPITFEPYWITGEEVMTFVPARVAARKISRQTPVAASSVVLRRERLDAGHLWGESHWYAMDWFWIGQWSLKGGFLYDARIGARYRYHEGNWLSHLAGSRSKRTLEIREIVCTLMNEAFDRGLITVEELTEEVLAWDIGHVGALLRTLSGPSIHPSLRIALMEIFRRRRAEMRHMPVSRHVRLAAWSSYRWLRAADKLDRLLCKVG
jgi:glycosyltransferase involved in cell wall biosynthesis